MSTPPESPPNPRRMPALPAWAPYVAPMAVFLLFSSFEGYFSRQAYTLVYVLKVVTVTGMLIGFAPAWRDEIRAEARMLLPGLLVGLAVFAEWVLIDQLVPYPHLGRRVALDPFAAFPGPVERALFLATRFYGLALLVPVMEELFWRSFLLRFVTEPDRFKRLPLGTFSWPAFAFAAGAFGLSHPEWLAAVICAAAYGLLLRSTRSLFACIVAHAVTNLALGIYVMATGQWRYW